MLEHTVSLDGAEFALTELDAASLKADCLASANGETGYVNFGTADGQQISVLLRPDSRVYFSAVETVTPIVPDSSDFLASFEADDATAPAFDAEWFDYVA